jgi:hypothetical protein
MDGFFNGKSTLLTESVTIPGAVFTGVSSKYHVQTNHGGLHTIQVDPSDPNKIHAIIMAAPNATVADTIGGAYPTRNIFYVFSRDAGATWSTPKAIAPVRAGFPDMILYKRGANYVPIIGAHRYISAATKDFIPVLYVEQGNPGDGNFKETLADRKSIPTKDQRDILWPSIAISPDNQTVYMAASLNTTTADKNYYPLQIGSFTLDAAGVATWNGWKAGPNGPGGSEGWATNGEYVLRVSPSGKLGVAWNNFDFSTPDLGLYFAESKDAGVTWVSKYKPLWQTIDSATANSTPSTYLRPANGLDMFYDGEKVKLITGVMQDAEVTTADVYLPNSGGLVFWNGDTNAAPIVLLSRIWPNHLDTGNFPLWSVPQNFDPQGMTNLAYPTIAHTTKAGHWSVFLEGWQQDIGVVGDSIYPYSGIFRVSTGDNGNSWTEVIPVLVNDTTVAKPTRFDYRFPSVSSYNALVGENFAFTLMFGADTAAGLFQLAGYPGFDEVAWYVTHAPVAGVAQSQPTTFSLQQNYPNPFNPSTTIKFELVKSANVELKVTDVLGRTVATILNAQVSAGVHSVKFDASNLATGVYSYTMKANGQSYTQRMVLSK